MLWVKALHIFSVVCWFTGLLYLPRLYVYHAQAEDGISIARFKIMERKLFFGIMTPSAVFVIISGCWLWWGQGFWGAWLNLKLGCVFLLLIYHFWCFGVLQKFKQDANTKMHIYYRWMNELPAFLLLFITVLVVVKPFS